MALIWTIILVICGLANGFATIPGFFWLLLIPMFLQDLFNGSLVNKS